MQIWQTDDEGAYDLQKDGASMDLRGVFHADTYGNYYLRTLLPTGYMIPMDGPVGDMIRAQKRPRLPARAYPFFDWRSGLSRASHRALYARG